MRQAGVMRQSTSLVSVSYAAGFRSVTSFEAAGRVVVPYCEMLTTSGASVGAFEAMADGG
jgi:hypothetical protein